MDPDGNKNKLSDQHDAQYSSADAPPAKYVSFGNHKSRSMDTRRPSKSIDLMKDEQNEFSPLIRPAQRSEDVGPLSPLSAATSPDVEDDWVLDQAQETKSSCYLMLLTLAIGG